MLLRKRDALQISDDLTLDTIEQIDLDKLHMAAKINLSQWREDLQKYIAFKIGRDATNVTNYFSEFIGCESITEAKIDTETLVRACSRFANEIQLANEDKINLKHFIYDTISEWERSGQQVSLSVLSTLIDNKWQLEEQNQGLFLRITQQLSLDDQLNIDKGSLRKLRRYSGKSSKITINFDNDALDDIVHFNSEERTLKINEIPADLLNQLLEEENEQI